MESARIRPEYLVGPLEYETEFYSTPPDVKWNPESGVRLHDATMTINVDTGDEFLIDELINFDDAGTPKLPSPVYRSSHTTSRPLYIATKPSSHLNVTPHLVQVGSHPPLLLPTRPNAVTRVASLDDRVLTGHHASQQEQQQHYSRLREALTTASSQTRLTAGQNSTALPRLPTQPVQCSRCGGELNSKCLVQACTKPDQTTCKICGQEMTIKCILAVCKQEQAQ